MRLTIVLAETDDEDKDAERFNALTEILKDYSGRDEIYFKVESQDEVKTLRWPSYIDCTPDLLKRLETLVGKDALQTTKPAPAL